MCSSRDNDGIHFWVLCISEYYVNCYWLIDYLSYDSLHDTDIAASSAENTVQFSLFYAISVARE